MSLSTVGWFVALLVFCSWSYTEIRRTVVAGPGNRSGEIPAKVLSALTSSVVYTLGTCAALVIAGAVLGLLALTLLAAVRSNVVLMLQELSAWPW